MNSCSCLISDELFKNMPKLSVPMTAYGKSGGATVFMEHPVCKNSIFDHKKIFAIAAKTQISTSCWNDSKAV